MLKTFENILIHLLSYTLLATFLFLVAAIESIVDLLLIAIGL